MICCSGFSMVSLGGELFLTASNRVSCTKPAFLTPVLD